MFHTKVKNVDCYGSLQDDSNFHVVCEDESDDGVWCEGNPNSADFTFQSWEDVVAYLSTCYQSEIVEIHAV